GLLPQVDFIARIIFPGAFPRSNAMARERIERAGLRALAAPSRRGRRADEDGQSRGRESMCLFKRLREYCV
ncbi:MAG TPA: hypothetical protein VEF36_14975, partial [Roseiarcus sp.]|nr:hypothetical protein [Roseiarcus sp.]